MSYQKGPGQTVVIALGGNALGNTPQEQLELVKNTASHIVDMVGEGVNVVVSHGNGPQVGMIDHTSLPHLLEHLVIDFQTRAAVRRGDGAEAGSAAAYADAGSALDAVFVGTTEWTDEAAGRARIEVSFLDDLVALRAFRDAIAFLGDAMVR